MNKHAGTTGLSTILAALAIVSAPALAQTESSAPAEPAEQQMEAGQQTETGDAVSPENGGQQAATGEAVIPEQEERQTLTDDLIGEPVYSRATEAEGLEKIGTIESLLLNEENRLTGVVVSIGGFLGFGAKSIAIDWEALEIEEFGPTEFVATIDMPREALEEAPAFKTLAEKEDERAREEMAQQPQAGMGTGLDATGGGAGTGGGSAME